MYFFKIKNCSVCFFINEKEHSTSEVDGGVNVANSMMLYIFEYRNFSQLKSAKRLANI